MSPSLDMQNTRKGYLAFSLFFYVFLSSKTSFRISTMAIKAIVKYNRIVLTENDRVIEEYLLTDVPYDASSEILHYLEYITDRYGKIEVVFEEPHRFSAWKKVSTMVKKLVVVDCGNVLDATYVLEKIDSNGAGFLYHKVLPNQTIFF
jgi:hypothetical protein